MVSKRRSKGGKDALTTSEKQAVERILTRAAEDIGFREALLRDPQSVLHPDAADERLVATVGDLGPDAATLLFSMRRVALEEAGINVRSSRLFLRDNGTSSSSREE